MRIEQTIYEVVPAGVYAAKVKEVTEHEGEWGDYLKLVFELRDSEHEGTCVTGIASAKFSPRSKLYKWARALFGMTIPRTHVLDTAELIGKQCQLVLSVIEDNDGAEFNKIDNVVSVKQQVAEQPAKAEPTNEIPW